MTEIIFFNFCFRRERRLVIMSKTIERFKLIESLRNLQRHSQLTVGRFHFVLLKDTTYSHAFRRKRELVSSI